jgi:hypothetical protein
MIEETNSLTPSEPSNNQEVTKIPNEAVKKTPVKRTTTPKATLKNVVEKVEKSVTPIKKPRVKPIIPVTSEVEKVSVEKPLETDSKNEVVVSKEKKEKSKKLKNKSKKDKMSKKDEEKEKDKKAKKKAKLKAKKKAKKKKALQKAKKQKAKDKKKKSKAKKKNKK